MAKYYGTVKARLSKKEIKIMERLKGQGKTESQIIREAIGRYNG